MENDGRYSKKYFQKQLLIVSNSYMQIKRPIKINHLSLTLFII